MSHISPDLSSASAFVRVVLMHIAMAISVAGG